MPKNHPRMLSLGYLQEISRVSSRIFCLGGKNSLESLTTPTFVVTLYWHVNNFGGKIEGLGGKPAPPSR